MYDGGKIITGIIIGLVILTFPFWYNLGAASPGKADPQLTQMAKDIGYCVAPADEIKTSHMQILDDWRNTVVRDGHRYYQAYNGKQHYISLQVTCMECHSNKKEFCDQCHNFANVSPFCWDCHIAPEEAK